MARKGPGHELRGTARKKKGGGVDRRRDGDARKEGNALRAILGIVIVLLEGLTWCESAPARIERTRRSDDVALSWSGPKDTFAFVQICHSRFALCGNANESFHCDLKIVEAIFVASNIFSQKTIKILFKLNKIKITIFLITFFIGNYYKQQSIILNM